MRIVIAKSTTKNLKKINEPFYSKINEKILELKNFPHTPSIKNSFVSNLHID